MPEYYKRPVFTLPATNQRTVFDCHQVGHAMADARGNCVRCGEPVEREVVEETPRSEYAELFGGPLDGEIVNVAEIIPSGRTNHIERDGVRHEYALDGEPVKGMVQLRFIRTLYPVGSGG